MVWESAPIVENLSCQYLGSKYPNHVFYGAPKCCHPDGGAFCPHTEEQAQFRCVLNPPFVDMYRLTKALYLRPEVLNFACLMEDKLRDHDKVKGRTSWANEDPDWLLTRLSEEVTELAVECEADDSHYDYHRVFREAADVANYAMFIADNGGRKLAGLLNSSVKLPEKYLTNKGV